MKLLVVDDDPGSLKSLTRTLQEEGYEVFPFEKGIDSLKLVQSDFFNVALVDFELQLSDFTGLEVVQKINAMSPDTGTIMMTEYGSFSLLQKALVENVSDCLVKPINPPVLKRAVEKALEKQRLILENKRLVDDLQNANVKLRRLSDLKSKFLSMVSHDLRSPLTAITGYSEFLSQGQYGALNDQQKRMLKIILQEGDYLNCLIGDLMDLASIEAGNFRLNKKPLLFLALVKEVLPRIEIFTSRKGIRLDIEGPADDLTILGDPQRLKQVLTNLLTNAVKHTSKGGHIKIRSSSVDDALQFQVVDDGAGIPPEVLERIFEQFYQVESSPARSEGLGLGLAIAKEIVQAHGGEISASSQGPGTGATFTVKIPFSKS